MKLNPLVTQIIVAPNFNNFTTSDVRSAYLALKSDSSLDSSTVRRMIYSELLKLVKKDCLKKTRSKNKGPTRFTKTDVFDLKVMPLNEKQKEASVVRYSDKQDLLFAKLNNYKAELLLNIGESEAYKELYSELPELVDELQPQYNLARDNNTRILGKIKAIEGLLKQCKPQEIL